MVSPELAKRSMQWQWQFNSRDKKVWCPVAESAQKQLEDLYSAFLGENTQESSTNIVSIRGSRYEIDFTEMVQTNMKTQMRRSLRRTKIWNSETLLEWETELVARERRLKATYQLEPEEYPNADVDALREQLNKALAEADNLKDRYNDIMEAKKVQQDEMSEQRKKAQAQEKETLELRTRLAEVSEALKDTQQQKQQCESKLARLLSFCQEFESGINKILKRLGKFENEWETCSNISQKNGQNFDHGRKFELYFTRLQYFLSQSKDGLPPKTARPFSNMGVHQVFQLIEQQLEQTLQLAGAADDRAVETLAKACFMMAEYDIKMANAETRASYIIREAETRASKAEKLAFGAEVRAAKAEARIACTKELGIEAEKSLAKLGMLQHDHCVSSLSRSSSACSIEAIPSDLCTLKIFPFSQMEKCTLQTDVQRLLRESSHAGSDSRCTPMKNAKVVRVETINNATIVQNYLRSKAALKEKYARRGLSKPSFKLQMSRKLSDPFPNVSLDESVCEQLLFHGTKHIDAVREEGFDERCARESGLYGWGVYFSEDSCKAFQYGSMDQKIHCIILARVALGESFLAERQMTGQKRPPLRDDEDVSSGRYDSVIANPGIPNGQRLGEQQHREFILFDGKQASPELAIYYTVGADSD